MNTHKAGSHATHGVDVVTVTLNPALDLSTTVDTIEPWRKMRCEGSQTDPGGGGINVARVVHTLGGRALAIAALGGHVGSEVAAALSRHGVPLRRVRVRSTTRQNFAATEHSTGRQFRFVQSGGVMSKAEWQRCLDATVAEAAHASCVVASGSLPDGVPHNFYALLAERIAELGIPVIVDTSGPPLGEAILAPVALVKPSVHELQALVHRPLDGLADYELAARELLSRGRCSTIVVSLGADGALVVPRDADSLMVHAPKVEVASTIGAGDSMVAAIALTLARQGSLVEAVRYGVAAGSAAVLRSGTSLCRADDVARLLRDVVVVPAADVTRRAPS